jgi:FAD/FMN-containing dehydrogenase
MHRRFPGWDPGFTPQDVAALVSVTHGPVLLAGGSGLDDELDPYRGPVLCEPHIVVGAADAADVVAAVRFGVGFDLPLTVFSPGHEPVEATKGGLVLTTGRLDRIHVDRSSRTAVAGAGALWSDVVRRAAEVRLAPLIPPVEGTSVVGRTYGWTAGHVEAIEYVCPDGHLQRVTPVSDRPRFARLCRAEPADFALGVVTEMTFALFR